MESFAKFGKALVIMRVKENFRPLAAIFVKFWTLLVDEVICGKAEVAVRLIFACLSY